MNKIIKVLVVDDSLLFRDVLSIYVNNDESINVVGKAKDPLEAFELLKTLKPDVITVDMEMPKMNGVEFVKKLMPENPIPIVVISSAPDMAFKALDAGAVEFIKKPVIKHGEDLQRFASKVCNIIKVAAISSVSAKSKPQIKIQHDFDIRPEELNKGTVVAIGASTGGVEALTSIITALPASMPPILITQHMPEKFTEMFAERMNEISKLRVVEAKDGLRLENGLVIVAAGNYHMSLDKDTNGYFIRSKHGEKVNGHCPSVDVLFESVAKTAGENAVGIILTGMGCDGAKGILSMRKEGAFTIGQDKESSIVYGMPMVAFNIGGICRQCPLSRVPDELVNFLESKSKER